MLPAKYGPHEKSVMHEHPASVAVFMSDGHVKFTLPDGASQDTNGKTHDARLSTRQVRINVKRKQWWKNGGNKAQDDAPRPRFPSSNPGVRAI